MINGITLKFTEGQESLSIPTTGITIFVGPNSSGKSLALREIERAVHNFNDRASFKIVQNFEIEWPSDDIIDEIIQNAAKYQHQDRTHENIFSVRYDTPNGHTSIYTSPGSIKEYSRSRSNQHIVASSLVVLTCRRLDGKTRFNLTEDAPAGDLLGPPQNVLSLLFQADAARKEIRTLLKEALNSYFVIDPTLSGQLRIRLSSSEPAENEQSLDVNARNFHSQATHIREASDGIQAYTGIIMSVVAGGYLVTLIDEPEAFLHPPLAKKLGQQLASATQKRKGRLFASTHSADFLIGCLQASNDVRVIRLEYNSGKSRGRVVSPEDLRNLYRHPLMRSSNIISGLFYDGVVVTESDNDRVFYNEIYTRLSEQDQSLPAILFVHAQNKTTERQIIEPLRKFGVPTAAIMDIDILKNGGKDWVNILLAAHIPTALHNLYAGLRSQLWSAAVATGKDLKADGGLAIYDKNNLQAAAEMFDFLDSYGIFVIRHGELESWLPELHISGKKTEWVLDALAKLGNDPTAKGYIKPSENDVWKFIMGVVHWIQNPARKGID